VIKSQRVTELKIKEMIKIKKHLLLNDNYSLGYDPLVLPGSFNLDLSQTLWWLTKVLPIHKYHPWKREIEK
jgi:hypothetical protein